MTIESPERAKVRVAVRRLKADMSARHRNATLENFSVSHPEQPRVISRLQVVAVDIEQFVADGRQLFLYGSVGAGKDHLAVSLLKAACLKGLVCSWVQGTDLYDRLAWAVRDDAPESQRDIYADMTAPRVLCLSDPVFARNWTPAKADALAKVVRRRHDLGKPTWVTTNAKSLAQCAELMWPDVYDRLKENAVVVHCDWPSYRKVSSDDG